MDASTSAPAAATVVAAGSEPQEPQWRFFASEGHVLLARVDMYRHKANEPIKWTGAGLLLMALAVWLAPYLGGAIGWVFGKVTGAAYSVVTAKLPEKAPAPELRAIVPVARNVEFQVDQVPTLDDAKAGIEAQMQLMREGKRTADADCDFTKKISEPWAATGQPVMPHCRYSSDGTRLWVWVIVRDGQRLVGHAGLLRKAGSQVEYLNVSGRGLVELPIGKPVDLALVPRAVAADLPELVEGGR